MENVIITEKKIIRDKGQQIFKDALTQAEKSFLISG